VAALYLPSSLDLLTVSLATKARVGEYDMYIQAKLNVTHIYVLKKIVILYAGLLDDRFVCISSR
jgi:hypothetical protein